MLRGFPVPSGRASVTGGPSQANTAARPAPASAGASEPVGHSYRPQLLTDSDDPAVRDAAVLLGGWGLAVRPARELAGELAMLPDARGVVVTTENPNALRDVFAEARRAGVPVVVGCADETMRRRAAELRADDW